MLTGHQTMSWGKSSSLAAAASGIPNGTHQRHHQGQEERGESVPLGKSIPPYITLHTNVNAQYRGPVGQRRGGQLVSEEKVNPG
jgi:hypothetical protein